MGSIEMQKLDAPWHTDTLLQVRTSKMQAMHNLSITTGIYKQLREGRVFCSFAGLDSDEHDLTFHGGIDKAVHQYFPGHYATWRAEYPSGRNFSLGGFGENLVSGQMNERNVCIGDKIRIGGVLLQVSLPRQPCFKLNHRFGLKAFSSQTWKKSRTGWYYRVLEEGWMEAGDQIVLVERVWPDWTIERVQEYLHRDTENREMLVKLAGIDEFGAECKKAFKKLLSRLDQAEARASAAKEPEKWVEYTLVEKKIQTKRITSFMLKRPGMEEKINPGSFVRLKLLGGLIRSYSIVTGTTNRFQLGIALDDQSRGGSKYMHESLNEGDRILVGKITGSAPVNGQASNHIFIVGGIGITAFLAHIEKYNKINFNYTLHFAVRSEDDVPFKDEIRKMGAKAVVYDKSKGERMDINSILKNRTWNSQVYTCGPQRMIDEVQRVQSELKINEEEIHYEAFQIDTEGEPFSVEVKKSGKRLDVPGDQTLLQMLREAGMEVESSCETGNCGTCRVEVCEGTVKHRGSGLAEEDKSVAMLSCVSRGVSHIVIDF